jgi:hypothetical protein
MNKFKHFSLLTLILCVFLASCKDTPEPVEITELAEYQDELLKFGVKYPTNWVTSKQQGERFIVFSSNDAKPRFLKYDPDGFPGAMIDVYATKVDETKTVDTIITKAQIFPAEYYKESAITVDGVQGRRFDYGFELEGGEFKGVFIIASKDQTTFTTLKMEAFDGSWETYAENFNAVISSLKLAETQQRTQDTLTVVEELPFPTDKLVQQRGNGFAISIPDNFYLGKSNAANMIASYNYIGDRRGDCNIQVDVLDGSKTKDLKKAATELASKYPSSPAVSGTKIGGLDGFVMNWRPMKDVKGKVYFVKKATKFSAFH